MTMSSLLRLRHTVVLPLVVLGSPVVAQERQGFVVLHFVPSAAEFAQPCRPQLKDSGRAPTPFRAYRTTAGELVTIKGHVALRFKAATNQRQIDSLIAATGIEVLTAVDRARCRTYVLSVARTGDDPITIATALQRSGLVDYAIPDLAAGRAEGIPIDSFFVDEVALGNAITRSGTTVAAAPSRYGMAQVLSEYAGPLLRVEGALAISSSNALDHVRSHGLTTLRLEIPEGNAVASVKVVIYSLTGTPVRQLVSETLAAGAYIVGWDGNDDRGRRVQPGVYVAVMSAGRFRETRRLVVR